MTQKKSRQRWLLSNLDGAKKTLPSLGCGWLPGYPVIGKERIGFPHSMMSSGQNLEGNSE